MATIMIVEDDVDLREPIADILESDGHRVLQAGNGQEALDLLDQGAKPSLILLDLMMPVLSGPELLELLQADGRLARLTVVVVSAFAEGAVPGVRRFVRKPISMAKLREIVAECAV